MVGTLKALISGAAVGGIFFMWVDNTIKVFARHIISTLAEEEKTLRASCKAVCGNCQEHYDDDEYHLIHGTHLCKACR